MADEPSVHDKLLLVRLNNLKISNISLDASATPPTATAPSEADDTPEDLIARFQKIQGRSTTRNDNKITAAAVAEEENEDVPHAPPSPTIEELLAELGPEDQWTLDTSELKEAHDLLAEAKRVLPEEGGTAAQEHGQNRATTGAEGSAAPPTQDEEEDQEEEQSEEAEAATSLQRILDEVELERQREPTSPTSPPQTTPPTHPSAPPDSFASLIFPSTPDTSLPSLDDLPSTPTTVPTSRKPKPKPEAKAEGFTDEQIDSWCTICCANAAVKCSGCDGDLYCWGCWREGHFGPDVGLEEKSHRWERVKGKRKG